MKSIVCVKRVPDTAANIKISDEGTVKTEGLEFVTSPYDEYGLEEAVQMKEEEGGEVVVMSLGGEEVEKTIQDCLARGGDRGVHLRTDRDRIDQFATGKALADAISGMDFDYDVIWFGKHAVDDDGFQVGQIVASLLDLPVATFVAGLELDGDRLICEREVEGGVEVVSMNTPCVITAEKGLNEPRYAKLQNIMKAKKKEIDEREVDPPTNTVEVKSMEEPPERPPGEIVGEGPEAVPELVRKLREEANVI